MRIAWLALLALVPACQQRKTAPAPASATPVTTPTRWEEARPQLPPNPRALGSKATFADLVKTARTLVKDGKGTSDARCVLRKEGALFRLDESLSPPAEIGDPPADLDALMAEGGAGIRIATPYGVSGTSGPTFVPLGALPRAASTSLLPALIVTDKGVYLRVALTKGVNIGGDHGPMPESDIARVENELAPRAQAIVVAAEAGVGLERLYEVLGWLKGAKGPVALAVPLAKGVLPPKPSATHASPGDKAGACPRGGLMDIPKGSTAGSYDDASIFGVSDGFSKAAAGCTSRMKPGGAGGKIKVAMRIEPDGHVSTACIEADDTGDADLRSCVLEAARTHVFPKPDTPGIVNFGNEVSFSPPSFVSKARCED